MNSPQPDNTSDHPRRKRQQMGWLQFFGVVLGFMLGVFLLKVLFGVVVGLVAKHVFDASSNTAFFAGTIAYLLPGLIIATLDLFKRDGADDEAAKSRRARKRQSRSSDA